MTAQTALSQAPSGKPESKPAAPPVAPQKTALDSRARVYWGDRWTIKFWLFCFAVMAAMNLVEAVHRFVLYLFASSPP